MTKSFSRRALTALAGAAALLASATQPGQAADRAVIGYQTVVEPSKVAQADGLYEKALGATIDWRKFDSGADVIAAIASGAVDIGYVGSSPLAAAASRELPIETIFVVGLIGESEALVARNGSGVTKIADLAGKKVAVPFVSTTHYSLLAALKHGSVDPKTVEILNCGRRRSPPPGSAATSTPPMSGIRRSARSAPRARSSSIPPRWRNGARRPSTPGSCAPTSPRRTRPPSPASSR